MNLFELHKFICFHRKFEIFKQLYGNFSEEVLNFVVFNFISMEQAKFLVERFSFAIEANYLYSIGRRAYFCVENFNLQELLRTNHKFLILFKKRKLPVSGKCTLVELSTNVGRILTVAYNNVAVLPCRYIIIDKVTPITQTKHSSKYARIYVKKRDLEKLPPITFGEPKYVFKNHLMSSDWIEFFQRR